MSEENGTNHFRETIRSYPTTDELRSDLKEHIHRYMKGESFVLIPSPTSSGKSHNGATTKWKEMDEVTGGQPVIHFHSTTDSRDDAVALSEEYGVESRKLLGREEACSTYNGNHDNKIKTPTGEPASEWLEDQVSTRGNTFSKAHKHLLKYNGDKLPCCPCPSVDQWDEIPYDKNEDVTADVIHATHMFSMVPTLVDTNNLFFDEQPDFKNSIGNKNTDDMSRSRFHDIVTGWLKKINSPITTWENFVVTASQENHEVLREVIKNPPQINEEWFFEGENAHALAPTLTEAAYDAFSRESDTNGRRVGKATSDLGSENKERDPRYSRTRITLIVDEDNHPTVFWNVPELGNARSIICLDAWPSIHEWKMNIGDGISLKKIVTDEELEKWRRHERGLEVVQIGDATRTGASEFAIENYIDRDRQKVVVESIRNMYRDRFKSIIIPKKQTDRFNEILTDDFLTMTYGRIRSNNQFKQEQVGLVMCCIDPGDDYVLDLLAARGFTASPETKGCIRCGGDDPDCPTCEGDPGRKPGRGFVGPDSEKADDILSGIRENSVAQAIGRWSRGPETPRALVFVWSNAIPDGLVDLKINKAWLFGTKQKSVVDYLRNNAGVSVKDIVDGTEVSDSSVRETLDRLIELDVVQRREIKDVNHHMITGNLPEHGILDLTGL